MLKYYRGCISITEQQSCDKLSSFSHSSPPPGEEGHYSHLQMEQLRAKKGWKDHFKKWFLILDASVFRCPTWEPVGWDFQRCWTPIIPAEVNESFGCSTSLGCRCRKLGIQKRRHPKPDATFENFGLSDLPGITKVVRSRAGKAWACNSVPCPRH